MCLIIKGGAVGFENDFDHDLKIYLERLEEKLPLNNWFCIGKLNIHNSHSV